MPESYPRLCTHSLRLVSVHDLCTNEIFVLFLELLLFGSRRTKGADLLTGQPLVHITFAQTILLLVFPLRLCFHLALVAFAFFRLSLPLYLPPWVFCLI